MDRLVTTLIMLLTSLHSQILVKGNLIFDLLCAKFHKCIFFLILRATLVCNFAIFSIWIHAWQHVRLQWPLTSKIWAKFDKPPLVYSWAIDISPDSSSQWPSLIGASSRRLGAEFCHMHICHNPDLWPLNSDISSLHPRVRVRRKSVSVFLKNQVQMKAPERQTNIPKPGTDVR